MKRTVSILLHFTELLAITGAIVGIGSIPLAIPLGVVALVPASKLQNDFMGNKIKDSIFSVSSNGRIQQNSLAKPKRFFSILVAQNKREVFTTETMNMFLELEKNKKNGETITYSTKSHSITLRLLQKLQKENYIEGLEFHKAGKSRLIFEKILVGNVASIKNKKTQMYQMSFQLTDKPRTREDLAALLHGSTGAKEVMVKKDIREQKVQLEEMKRELEKINEHDISSKRQK